MRTPTVHIFKSPPRYGLTYETRYGTVLCMAETKTTIRIDDELLRRLKIVAIHDRKTVSEIIRGLVTAYVQKKEAEGV